MKLAATTLAIVMVTLTACASGEASQTDSTSTEFDSAQTSLESAVLPVINEQMEEMGIPGLVAIVASPDRGTYKVAAGVANIDTNEPMKVENHFRIGSISKTLTATVVLQLAQEGKLGLDDALAPYFPTLDTNGATIRQALNMTSGIPTYTPDQFLNDLANNPARV
ncbi:beta-lactamase family protein [Rhodococcus globerulus]|nr:beta-lactamase family protein [Rhodococcus globerulus]